MLVIFLSFVCFGAFTQSSSSHPPNVLFIMVDDLRPFDIKGFGDPLIKSPNIDALESQGCVFTNQFVTVPTCGASRNSLLTGMLPRKKVELDNGASEGTLSKMPKTNIPETFIDNLRRHGYYTVGIGKISHSPDGYVYPYLAPRSNQLELPYSWDEMLLNPGKWGDGWNAFFAYANGTNRNTLKAQVKPYEKGEVGDDGYPDGLSADLAVKKMQELAKKDQPFFLAVGFFKPHLPFNSPKKYWDLYDESKIPLTPSPGIPKNVNKKSLHESGEFNQYKLGDEKASLERPVSDDYARKLKHAYFAAASYSDAQVGKVLGELKQLGLDKNTIVILWSDHGWHLGDDLVWGKHTLFDWALRSVLIVKAPGMKIGSTCNKVISSVDIYPTLMELCGIEMPHKTDGTSFTRLLKKPNMKDWGNTAYSYFNNGITVRTTRYRLTKYFRAEEPTIELYDHKKDPFENDNVAAAHPALVKKLMKTWEKGNTGVYDKKKDGVVSKEIK
ncbi:MAG: sulfatase [Bacillota bacterium]|nr:sulfatase [Bacillota bacterium]